MNKKAWKRLSSVDKNARIAELCGWKSIHNTRSSGLVGTRPLDNMEAAVPDYVNDLNAICDACRRKWEELGMAWQVRYDGCLYSVIGHHDHMEHEAIHSTASQRSEAFALIMGSEDEPLTMG